MTADERAAAFLRQHYDETDETAPVVGTLADAIREAVLAERAGCAALAYGWQVEVGDVLVDGAEVAKLINARPAP